MKLKPLDLEVIRAKLRNPYRIMTTNGAHEASQAAFTEMLKKQEIKLKKGEETPGGIGSRERSRIYYNGIYKENKVKQIQQWEAHTDAIKYIKFIGDTDIPLIFTCGYDKMAKLWNHNGKLKGILRQGIRIKGSDGWTFPLQTYENNADLRNQNANKVFIHIFHH